MQVEINQDFVEADTTLKVGGSTLLITPPFNDEYWLFRVKVSKSQAVVAFPKFATIGIGFQTEEDWNTNLPYSCEAEYIFNHIAHNKGDKQIKDEDCIEAIKLLQDTIKRFKKADNN